MDCDAFEANLVDLLYEELDAGSAKAMLEHAAGCASCTAKRVKLERAQEVFRGSLALPSPAALEGKILAAAEQAGAKAPPARTRTRTSGPAKVFRLFARPELAVAATLILFIGGALFLRTSSRRSESSASIVPASPRGPAEPVPAQEAPPPPPGVAEPVVAAEAATIEAEPRSAASAVAMGDAPASRSPGLRRSPAAGAPAPAPKPMARSHASDLDSLSETKAAGKKDSAKGAAPDGTYAQAKALFDAGRYAEALPQFEALASASPDAALYAARCVAKLRGCTAAAPRFERIRRDNAGTAAATQAAAELSRCQPAPSATVDVMQ